MLAGTAPTNCHRTFDRESLLNPWALQVYRTWRVWDYTAANVDALRQFGITARHVPLGTGALLNDTIGHQHLHDEHSSWAPPIDVLFYGTLTPRRAEVLQELRSELAPHGFVVAHLSAGLNGLFGAALDSLLQRAKVVLNVRCFAARPFDSPL